MEGKIHIQRAPLSQNTIADFQVTLASKCVSSWSALELRFCHLQVKSMINVFPLNDSASQ